MESKKRKEEAATHRPHQGSFPCCSVKSYLFVNFGELLKIVLKKGDFLFLCCTPPRIVRVHLSALHNEDKV